MLIPKEVIRPGTYWYRDESTGEPRKLTVTPELCRYWHDQGNAMLSDGLTVPVPFEHDFQAHPMTPADKLKNNAGWLKRYTLKGDALFSEVDITDDAVAKKLPHTIRWTSPWINSFTDGKGKEWRNVISHLALTTRPRIIDQQPFGSIAAALSVATDLGSTFPVPHDASAVGAGGFHLSRAGLLTAEGLPAYPMAFSMWGGGIPLTTDAHGHEHDESGRFGKGFGEKSEKAHVWSGIAESEGKKKGGEPIYAHRKARKYHEAASNHHLRRAMAAQEEGDHEGHRRHMDASLHHDDMHKKHDAKVKELTKGMGFLGRIKSHFVGAVGDKPMPKPPPKAKKPESMGGKPDPNPSPSETGETGGETGSEMDEGGGDENALMETEIGGDGGEGTPPEAVPSMPGDVGMEEMLCDLLGALGIHIEHTGDESMFKRSLYNAAMTKIHELAGKGDANQQPNRTNPPGQPPNNPRPGQAGQNPLIQQEQQPMFMSLEEINKIADPTMKGIALAMHAENQKLRADLDAGNKTANSLRDAKLKEENEKRNAKVAWLGKLKPSVKARLEAMMARPEMALSLGEGGAVVDPMAETLAMLDDTLANVPLLWKTDASALSVAPQPTDAGALDDKRVDELANHMARLMGAPPEAQAS